MSKKIFKFLRSNILTILLAFIPPIVIWYYLQKDVKSLEIEILASVSVISIEEKYSEGIEIIYNQKRISSLSIIDIKVRNNGNQPIERADFDIPLVLKCFGIILSPIEIIDSNPPDLPVTYKVQNDSISIEPLLLNSDDYFTIRTRIADNKKSTIPIKAFSRIKGVNIIEVIKAEKDENAFWINLVTGAIVSIGTAISLFSLFKLFRRFGRFTIAFPGIGIELSEIQSSTNTAKRVSELADQLQIARYDYKSNILLLRLKIENLLRELAREANLPQGEQMGPLVKVSRALEVRGFIPSNVYSLINNISPIMNRELHESESYLSEKEYESIQNVALSIVAILEDEVNKRINKNDNRSRDSQIGSKLSDE